jgi:DNA-binding CsgD family transcriptional regulator
MREKKEQKLNRLLQLIDNVYEAALDETRWAALAPDITKTFGATSAVVQIRRTDSSGLILSATDNVNANLDSYSAHFWQQDVWVNLASKLVGMSKVGASKDLIDDSEFQETEFYRDWLRQQDLFYLVGAVFPSGQDKFGVLGIHRPRMAGSYDEDDKIWVARFLPHLQRALRVRDRLGEAALQKQISIETLNHCGTAVFLVTAHRQIIYTNQHAEALLKRGVGLRCFKGRLTATDRTDAVRLADLILRACNGNHHEPTDGLVVLSGKQVSLSALIAPFHFVWAGHPSAGAIVLVRDTAAPITAEKSLQALFSLTPTESRIAQALADGRSLADIAAIHNATLNTVRKQLKSIFDKTGTNRQAQLVTTILRSVATLARDDPSVDAR